MKKIYLAFALMMALVGCSKSKEPITFTGVVENIEDQVVVVSVLQGADFDKAKVAIGADTQFEGLTLADIKQQDQLEVTILPKIAESDPVQVTAVKIKVAKIKKESNEAVYQKITPEKAKEMMADEGVIILDVRTPEEYAQGHIANAVLLPDYDIATKACEQLPDKEAKILVYCRSGRRSEAAAKELIKMGYTSVYDFGGIIDWPYEVTK